MTLADGGVRTADDLALSSAPRRRLVGELGLVIVGELIGVVGLAIGVRWLTQLMTPDTYGELALGLSVATLTAQSIVGPLGSAAERFFAVAAEKHQVPQLLRALRDLMLGALAVSLTIGVALVVACWAIGEGRWIPLVAAASAFALLTGGERMLDSLQNAARARGVVAWHQGLRQWIRPAAAVVLLQQISSTSSVALSGFALASLVVLASQWLFFRRILQRFPSDRSGPLAGSATLTPKSLLRYAGPFGLWGVFTWMQLSADRWALQIFSTPDAVGLYAVVFQIGISPLFLLGTVLAQLLGPIVFARAGDGRDPQRLASAFRATLWLVAGMLALTVAIIGAAAVLHRQIFALLAGPSFQSVSGLLPLAILVGGLFNVGQLACLIPLATGNSRLLLAPKIGTAVVAVPLSLLGAAMAGVFGVLVAGAVFSVVYAAWTVLVGVRVVRQSALPAFG